MRIVLDFIHQVRFLRVGVEVDDAFHGFLSVEDSGRVVAGGPDGVFISSQKPVNGVRRFFFNVFDELRHLCWVFYDQMQVHVIGHDQKVAERDRMKALSPGEDAVEDVDDQEVSGKR